MNALPPDFLPLLTHELKNHVASIHSAVFLLRTHGRDLAGAKEQKWLGTIMQSETGLRDALDQIETFDRVAVAAEAPPWEMIELPNWLGLLCDQAAQEMKESTVRIQVLPGATGPRSVGKTFLGVALSRLLVNALKFGPPGSVATVAARDTAEGLEFIVNDAGEGVTPAEEERLFTPFFQARNARNRPGCGLGLAIARAAVTRLGGTVTYRHRPESGTEFRLLVPVQPGQA